MSSNLLDGRFVLQLHFSFSRALFVGITGALQGLNKQETVDKHGKDQVLIWRRSYDIPPPAVDENSPHFPAHDPRYKDVPVAQLPKTESLKLTEERFMPLWEEKLVPAIKSGEKLLIAAHGNTLRKCTKWRVVVWQQNESWRESCKRGLC